MTKKLNRYQINKEAAKYRSDKPSKTDQSQAAQTDINVIVKQFLTTGQIPNQKQPFYADFSILPKDLRGMIDMSRSIRHFMKQLPKELQDMPREQLLSLTPEQLTTILTPPAPPPDKKEEPPK